MVDDSSKAASATAVVVNDDVTQLRILAGFLRKEGLDVQAFEGAQAALAAMDPDAPPDLIVTDLYMPEIDGWRFCRLLRSREYEVFNPIPILVVSATFAGDEASRITADLGANAFMSSPVDGKRFAEQVRVLLSGERPRDRLRILLVEDDKPLAKVLEEAFAGAGCDTDTAATNQEATTALGCTVYDVAVLDYHLPDGPGDALLETFHAQQPACVCIMMTADPDPGLAVDWMRRGAAAYLRKPFELSYLIELCARARRENALLHVEDLLEERTRELRASEERYRAIAEDMPVLLCRFLPDGEITYVNEAYSKYFEKTPEELIGASFLSLAPEKDRETVMAHLSALTHESPTRSHEHRVIAPDGEIRWQRWTCRALFDEQGQACVYQSIGEDITKRKQAEEERAVHLRFLENMARINQVIQGATDVEQLMSDVLQATLDLLECDRAWLLYPCDPEAESWRVPMMRTRPEYRNDEVMEADVPIHPDDRRVLRAALDSDVPVGFGSNNEEPLSTYLTPKYRVRAQLVTAVCPRTGKPWAFGLHQCSRERDWTDEERDLFREIGRRLGEALSSLLFLRDLRASEERWRSLTLHSPDHVMLLDCDGTIRFINYAVPERTIEQVLGTSVYEHMPEAFRQAAADCFKQVVESNQSGTYTTDYRAGDGEVRHFETRVAPVLDQGETVALISSARDITERKQHEEERLALERQVQHAQKLESLGVLAGGIAHDFNNILMAVLGYADLAIEELGETHPARSSLREIEKGAKRAADLTRQMLAYSGKGKFIIEAMDVSALMDDMAHLLRTSIPRTIVLNLHLERSLLPIEADPAQMQQVIMNLITNAAESIGEENGTIALSTGEMVCTEEYLARSLAAQAPHEETPPPGFYVYFEVSDTGCGMDEETKARVFEPFFTTKFTGRGLGMAAVLGIVRGHTGAIMLDTEPGKGSTFRVLFPAVEEKHAATDEAEYEGPETEGWAACGTILVVDDEEVVRGLTIAMLERQGFSVLGAANGREGVEIFREHAGKIACVILDLTMPLMSGEACFAALRQVRDDVKVILVSGYTEEQAIKHFPGESPAAFLHKPFTMAELREKTMEILREEGELPNEK